MEDNSKILVSFGAGEDTSSLEFEHAILPLPGLRYTMVGAQQQNLLLEFIHCTFFCYCDYILAALYSGAIHHHPRSPAAVETVRPVRGRMLPSMERMAPGTLLDGSPV